MACLVKCGIKKIVIQYKQGKSEGFDGCDRSTNLTKIGFKSSIFQPVWPWNLMDDTKRTIGQLFYATLSLLHHFVAIGEFKLELQYGNVHVGSKSMIFLPCDLEIWRMTFKNNRAPLLCHFKLCAAFRSHWWIQTGVIVRKRLIRVQIDNFLAVWPWNLTHDLQKL